MIVKATPVPQCVGGRVGHWKRLWSQECSGNAKSREADERKRRFSLGVGREQREGRSAGERFDRAKVALVEGGDAGGLEPGSEGDEGGVG